MGPGPGPVLFFTHLIKKAKPALRQEKTSEDVYFSKVGSSVYPSHITIVIGFNLLKTFIFFPHTEKAFAELSWNPSGS